MTSKRQAKQATNQALTELKDEGLDQAIGGNGSTTGRVTSIAVDPSDHNPAPSGGVNVALGDGSVRFVK